MRILITAEVKKLFQSQSGKLLVARVLVKAVSVKCDASQESGTAVVSDSGLRAVSSAQSKGSSQIKARTTRNTKEPQ
ncbi:hypothetical protein [Dictyobacter arantiisoli]|uniref:hypothetical protein n=1 Tax=Dictyobacter arantiisoli TaxID=2014874 RepID=UPI001F18518F|nr:hypothetical protein [Dictyobacter arantiisoli]